MSNQSGPFVRGGLVAWAALGLVVSLALILACAGGFLVWRARGAPAGPATSTDTPTARPSVTVALSRTATPTPSRTPTATATAKPGGATGTPTATPRGTARPSRTPIPAGTPTPIICDDPETLARQEVAPGQQFTCTFSEEDLNEQLSEQTDLPCTQLTVAFIDGQIHLVCFLGFRLTAILEVEAEDCRMDVEVVGGTLGFTEAVQTALEDGEVLVPYDKICVEEATVGDGEITISGYGR